jgi:di/tricarboxylate transporter
MNYSKLLESKWIQLLFCTMAVAVVWLTLLPQLSSLDVISEHVKLMEERNVRAGAMYYTDLERLPLRPMWVEDEIHLWPK